jgi:hypothetical protein
VQFLDFEGPTPAMQAPYWEDGGDFAQEGPGVLGEGVEVDVVDAAPDEVEEALVSYQFMVLTAEL